MKKKANDIKENGLRNMLEQIAIKYDALGYNRQAPRNSQYPTFYNTKTRLITFDYPMLSYRYATDGMFRTIIEQPVLDAFRGKLSIRTKKIDNDEINVLENYIVQNEILDKLKMFFILDRLFGGAGLIIEEDGKGLQEPFSVKILEEGSKLDFIPTSRWELSNIRTGEDIDKKQIIKPWEDFIYYGEEVNSSRVLLLKGKDAPYLIQQQLQGWGLSAVEPLVAPLNAFDKIKNVVYELLDEAKIDVWRLNNLNQSLQTGQEKQVMERVSIANRLKSYENAIVLDNMDEFLQKQLNLSGIADILQQFRLEIAAAMKMPLTKIFGMSASGFNSGEDDIENYNGWVESELRTKVYDVLKKVLKIIGKSLFGIILDDVEVEFPPLRTPKTEEVEGAKDRQFARALQLFQNKQMTSKELADYLNENDIITMDTKASRGELPEYIEASMEPSNIDELDL